MKSLLFKPQLVAKIATGDKTKTRRIMDEQPTYALLPCGTAKKYWALDPKDLKTKYYKCPLEIGEIVYIKEVFYQYGKWVDDGITDKGRKSWKFCPDTTAKFKEVRYLDNPPANIQDATYRGLGWYKRTPLFMEERQARHKIRITDIRVERIQSITEMDAKLEGVEYECKHGCYYLGFESLWKNINGANTWEDNVFVWVYTFELFNPPGEKAHFIYNDEEDAKTLKERFGDKGNKINKPDRLPGVYSNKKFI